jgi:hypothetical protein
LAAGFAGLLNGLKAAFLWIGAFIMKIWSAIIHGAISVQNWFMGSPQ